MINTHKKCHIRHPKFQKTKLSQEWKEEQQRPIELSFGIVNFPYDDLNNFTPARNEPDILSFVSLWV